MKYLLLSLAVLVPVAGVSLLAAPRGGRARRDHWLAAGIAAGALIVLTAVFDSLMIHADLFYYADEFISGMRIGLAPIEDFAYPIAGVLLLPVLWRIFARGEDDALSLRARLRALFWASRPVSWINTAYPFAAAMFLTHREVDALLILGTFYYLVPYNMALYGINDVFDYQSDLRNPRKGSIEGALLGPEMHRSTLGAALVTNVPFLVLFVYLADPLALLAIAISTFALLAYSVPKLRFKERPVLDSLTSSTHFVSPAIVGFALAGAQLTTAQALILGAFFLWGMAAHAFGAVQDVMPDRAAGLGSIATVFGAKATVRIALAFWTIAGILMLFTPFP